MKMQIQIQIQIQIIYIKVKPTIFLVIKRMRIVTLINQKKDYHVKYMKKEVVKDLIRLNWNLSKF